MITYFYLKPGFYISLAAILPLLTTVAMGLLRTDSFYAGKIYLMVAVTLSSVSPLFLYLLYYFRPYTSYFSLLAESGILLLAVFTNIIAKNKLLSNVSDNPFSGNKFKNILLIVILFYAGFILSLLMPRSLSLELTMLGSILLIVIIIINSISIFFSGKSRWIIALIIFSLLSTGFTMFLRFKSGSIEFYSEQKSYEDKVVFSARTDKHDIAIIQWKKYYWLFLDGLKYLSTADDYLFYEPFIHPAANLVKSPENILILGGENGCAAYELLKYPSVKEIDIIPYDTSYINLARKNTIFLKINNRSLLDAKVKIMHEGIIEFISNPQKSYDLVIVDLPDPRTLEFNQFYTVKFYSLCYDLIRNSGILVTQAGSPFYAPDAFVILRNTIHAAGFSTYPIHNQVLTLGEWGWIIAGRKVDEQKIKRQLGNMEFSPIQTRWINHDAILLLTHFGKSPDFNDTISINTFSDPLIFREYQKSIKELAEP